MSECCSKTSFHYLLLFKYWANIDIACENSSWRNITELLIDVTFTLIQYQERLLLSHWQSCIYLLSLQDDLKFFYFQHLCARKIGSAHYLPKDKTSYMIQLLAVLGILKSRENKKCCGREQAQGHNDDCYGKHKSMISIWGIIPKGLDVVSKKLRSPKNRWKCIGFEKERKEKGKKNNEQEVYKDSKIICLHIPSLLFFFAYCFSKFSAIIV